MSSDVTPRSEEHERLRAGKISGSRIYTVMYGGPNAWNTLLGKLNDERKEGTAPLKESYVPSLAHGIKYEKQALAEYEMQNGVELQRVAWLEHPVFPEYVGCSPDGVLPELRGGVEAKNPYDSANHARVVHYQQVPPAYLPQVHLAIECAGADWWDFVSHDPHAERYNLPRMVTIRVHRDEKYLGMMHEKITAFIDLLAAGECAKERTLTSDMISQIRF